MLGTSSEFLDALSPGQQEIALEAIVGALRKV